MAEFRTVYDPGLDSSRHRAVVGRPLQQMHIYGHLAFYRLGICSLL